MNKTFPDRWIRKAIFDKLDGIVVGSDTINCYDTRITGANIPDDYIIMSTQTALVEKTNKCEYFWNSSILLDVYTTYERPGNPGSRLKLDNIMDVVRQETDVLTLDVGSGLSIVSQIQSFPNDITTTTDNEIIYRKFCRIEMVIK